MTAGAPRAAGALVALLIAAPAVAQPLAATPGAGVSLASRLLLDGNGTTVRLGPAPHLALDVVRRGDVARRPLRPALTVRVARAGVRVSTAEAGWSAGAAWQADVVVGLVHPVAGAVRLRGAVGATLLRGPRDVAPFERTLVSPAAEAGADVRVGRGLRADLRVQGYRVAPAGGAAGGVVRLLVGLSRAR